MSIIEHIILFSLLFGVYAFWGQYNANKSGLAFWRAAIVPILLFVLITGSRYGWGNDYFLYKALYENVSIGLERAKEQVGFMWLNQFLNSFGFGYVGGFMIYAFIFILCAFVFIRSFGAQSSYMYCFLVPAALLTSTDTIRQGVATSFIFLALMFLQNKKWIYLVIAVIIAYSIHSATIITLFPLLGSFFLIKKPVHFAISIPLFLFFTFIYNPSTTAYLAGFLEKYVSLDSEFQGYIDNSERWFGEDAIKSGDYRGSFALIFTSLSYISIFYLGYWALKIRNDKRIVYIFNVVVVGCILLYAMAQIELLDRIVRSMQMFYFVPVGYIFYVYFTDCKRSVNDTAIRLRKHFLVGMTFIVANLVRSWGRFILFNENADFFWNY